MDITLRGVMVMVTDPGQLFNFLFYFSKDASSLFLWNTKNIRVSFGIIKPGHFIRVYPRKYVVLIHRRPC